MSWWRSKQVDVAADAAAKEKWAQYEREAEELRAEVDALPTHSDTELLKRLEELRQRESTVLLEGWFDKKLNTDLW